MKVIVACPNKKYIFAIQKSWLKELPKKYEYYLHFTSRYGFPKLNVTISIKIRARIFQMDFFTIGTGVVERGAKVLQFDVCCKAIGQNFDCGCDRYTFLHLDLLVIVLTS